jgi:sterol desaturase/sphingolipid hydroxylase (fatty acid hydroxylase superfamily)
MPRLGVSSLPWIMAAAVVVNGTFFFVLGGAFHRLHYVRRASEAARWRLQATRPMPTWVEMRARLPNVVLNLVIFNAIVGAAFWAIATGRSRVVFRAGEHGALLLLVTALAAPLVFHGLTYVVHRALHTPWLFRHVHSVHHRAATPVFVDAHYMHPAEAVYSAVALMLPAFLLPTHVVAFGLYYFTVGFHELLDHTGVRVHVPGLSPSSHHDEHHRSVKRCYGQALPLLDAWLGTGPRS